MKLKTKSIAWTVALAGALALAAAQPCAAQLTPTDLNPPGSGWSRAYCINASGQTAGFAYDAEWYEHAVLWDGAGNMTTLDLDGFFGNTEANVMNDNAQVVGTWGNTTGSGAFIWDSVAGMKDIGALSYSGVRDSQVRPAAINANGWVIGSSQYNPGDGWIYSRTWIYRDGSLEQVMDADGQRIAGLAINDAGQVMGQQSYDPFCPVIWEKPVGATSPTVTILSSSSSDQARAINASGQVAIENYSGEIKIWRPEGTRNADGTLVGTLTPLGITTHYPGAEVHAVGIDNSGRVYGTADAGSSHMVWVWQDGAITDIAAPGSLNSGGGGLHVNHNGQVAGSYMVPGTWNFAGFLWNVGQTSLVDLLGLGGKGTQVSGINDSGRVAGFDLSSDLIHEHACVWCPPAPVNQSPTLTVPGSPLPGVVGSPVTFTATATDPDEGDTLTFSLGATAPAGASIDSATGVFTWTPTAAGTLTFEVTVTDAGGLTDTKQVTVDVSALALAGVTATPANPKSKLVTVTVQISNPNATTDYNVTVTSASLGGANTTSALPLVYGAIKPGASKKCTLQFKNVPSGAQTLTVNGTSSMGDFFTTLTVTVP
jgi:hypothetical protein